MPGRSLGSAVAVTRTTVSPYRTVTAPSACLATFPVSRVRGLPPKSMVRVLIRAFSSFGRGAPQARCLVRTGASARPAIYGRHHRESTACADGREANTRTEPGEGKTEGSAVGMKTGFPSGIPRSRSSGSLAAIRFAWIPPAGAVSRDRRAFLFANPELLDQLSVALRVPVLEVVQETAAGPDHLEQAAAGRMSLGVRVEVSGQILDPATQDRDLDLWRSRIRRVGLVGTDDLGLEIFRQRHAWTRSGSSFRFKRATEASI